MKHAPHVIAPELVIRYAQLNKQYHVICDEREALNKALKEALAGGEICPDTTPYLLKLESQERCAYGWKEICESVVSILPARAMKAARMLVERMQAEKKSVPVLKVDVNPKYQFRMEVA